MESEPVPFVDTHHHLWDLTRHRYDWLEGDGLADTTAWIGDYGSIRRSYLVEDFLADSAGSGLVKSIHIEAVWGQNSVGETRWIQGIADRTGFPHGIVAFTDLRSENAERELEMHCEFPRIRGVRMTQFDGLLSDPNFRRGFAAMARRGLSYDINVRWSGAGEALDLARAFPDVPILVGNMANPASLGAEEFANWRQGMRLLAQAPNIAMKICGLGMANHAWTLESIRPWVLEAITIFEPGRCMFGTNWPVDRLYSSYHDLVAVYRTITAAFSPHEQRRMFGAERAPLLQDLIQGFSSGPHCGLGGGVRLFAPHRRGAPPHSISAPAPSEEPGANHAKTTKEARTVGSEENKSTVLAFWERCWNEKDVDSLDDTHVRWFAQNGVPQGTAVFKALFRGFFEAFPDVRVSVDDVVVGEDKVVMRVTYRGTHLGEYEGIPGTGRSITVTGLGDVSILGGRIVHHWHEMDHLAILHQLGATVRTPAN